LVLSVDGEGAREFGRVHGGVVLEPHHERHARADAGQRLELTGLAARLVAAHHDGDLLRHHEVPETVHGVQERTDLVVVRRRDGARHDGAGCARALGVVGLPVPHLRLLGHAGSRWVRDCDGRLYETQRGR
jgi:hypothetical protein